MGQMKSCLSTFRMRVSSSSTGDGPRHRASHYRTPQYRHFNVAPAKSPSHHATQPSLLKPNDMLQESVAWTEATETRHHVMLYEEIGRGNYGAVYRGVDGMTGENVAVKELRTYGGGVPGSRRSPFRVAQEADLHEAVHDCPAVATVKARLRFEDKDCLVTELCTGGDLAMFSKHHGPLRETQLAEVAREATRVLQICHKRAILHGDIKAANFVIRSEIDAWRLACDPTALRSGWLKAVDFGCSMRMGKGHCTYRVGTPMNWPPEVFNARFGLAADMWSMGTMLYQLTTRRMPYFTPEEQETFETEHEIALKIVTRDVDFESSPWETFSPDAKDFLRRLLLREAAKRMTAETATRHAFLKRTAAARKCETPTVTKSVTTPAMLSAAAE